MLKKQKKKSQKKSLSDKDLEYPQGFPYDEDTPLGMGGKIYQWVKGRYYLNRRPWKKSDVFIWKGACIHMGSWIGIIVFITVFGWIFMKTYDKYGIGKFLTLVSVIILIRMNFMIKYLGDIRSQLIELNKKTPNIPELPK